MKKGFTLIELLITISIIALFSGVVFVSLDGSRKKSRDTVRITDLKNLSLAAQNYFAEHSKFPTTQEYQAGALDEYFGDGLAGSVPQDPLENSLEYHYYYSYDSNENKYCLEVMMETMQNDVQCGSKEVNYKIKGP